MTKRFLHFVKPSFISLVSLVFRLSFYEILLFIHHYYFLGLYRISGNRTISGRITPKTGYPGIRIIKNPDIRLPNIRPDTGYRIPDTDD